jgi:hypothetical protein
MMRAIKTTAIVLLSILVAAMTLWGALALYYSHPAGLQIELAVGYALCGLATLIGLATSRWRQRAAVCFAAVFAALLAWWSTIEPSNDRNWKPEVAVMPYATIDGDLITIHNIRNFDYRTEADFTRAYYDKIFDVRKLESVDLIATYWMGPDIAHVFLSFGFGDNDYLAISIERRDEQGEGYSTIKGLFRQFELYYVVADERDVIRVRTNYRKDPPEDVYLYRAQGPVENARRLFLEYVRKINELKDKPEFYNTLTTNCTGNIWLHTRINPEHLAYSWKLLLSGHVPEYVYDQGRLDRSLPFPELQRRSLINSRAQSADQAEDFSRRIREELPGMAP